MDVDLPEVHARHSTTPVARGRRRRRPVGAHLRLRRVDGAGAGEPRRHRQLLGGRARSAARPSSRSVTGSTVTCSATDPLRAYDDSALVAAAVFRAPDAMERPCAVSYGPVPGSVYCGHRFLDVLIHGWDVATLDRAGHHARRRPGRGVLGGHRTADRHARRERRVRHPARPCPTTPISRRSCSPSSAAEMRTQVGSRRSVTPHGSAHHRDRHARALTVGAHLQPESFDHRHGDRAVPVGGEGGRPPSARRAGPAAVRPRRRLGHRVLELGDGDGARPIGGPRSSRRWSRPSSTSSATTATTPAGRPTTSAPSASNPSRSSSKPPAERLVASPVDGANVRSIESRG